MKTGSPPNQITRIQVHEKLKKNFQALCVQCPQWTKNHEALDDSLTSLQWLWNLNVNISNPISHGDKTSQRITSSASRFSNNIFRKIDNDTANMLSGERRQASWAAKASQGGTNCLIQSATPSKSIKATMHFTKSSSKKHEQFFAHVFRKPCPSTASTQKSTSCGASASVNSIEGDKKGLFPSFDGDQRTVGLKTDLKLDLGDLSHLPYLSTSKPNKTEQAEAPSEGSSARQYSFSPREMMLDVLPGQIDYKNNRYLKPTHSFTTLICMAIQSSKHKRLTFGGVCKWITDNFMYYRYADPDWQNSVKLNLTQGKYFSKVQRKKDATNCLWQISREYQVRLQDFTTPLLNGNLQDANSQLEPTGNSDSLSIPKPTDTNYSSMCRKRKQPTPQKIMRGRNTASKKNRGKSVDHQNLLQEEAPELGSLKGDFNWNSIFDEVFGSSDTELTAAVTSLSSKPSTRGNDVASRYVDDVVSGSLLAHDMLVLPDLPENGPDTASEPNSSKRLKTSSTGWHSPNDCSLHLVRSPPNPARPVTPSVEESHQDLIKEFFKELGELNTHVTNSDPETSWIPECVELEEMLRENEHCVVTIPEVEGLFTAASSKSVEQLSKHCDLVHQNTALTNEDILTSIS